MKWNEAYIRLMIVLTAMALAWATSFWGMEKRWKTTALVNVELEQAAEKVISETFWGVGLWSNSEWSFRISFLSLMSTGNLQVEGQFEKGDVGEEIDTVERSRVSWSPPWSFRVFTQEIPSLRSLPCPRDAGFPSSHSHRSWGVWTSERSGCQQRLFHLEDSVNNCSYIC